MGENFDVLIAFVIVVAGLAVTVQLLTDVVKNVLRMRWAVYSAVICRLYSNMLSKSEQIATGRKTIQSVRDRLRQFVGKVELLWRSVHQVRSELAELYRQLGQVEPDASDAANRKLVLLREWLSQRLPELRAAVDRVRGLNVRSLFGMLRGMSAKAEEMAGGLVLSSEGKSSPLHAIDELIDAAENLFRETEGATVKAVEDTLSAALQKADVIEREVGRIHQKLTAQFDDTLAQLQDSYGRRARIWSFVVAVVLCVGLNADSITMYQSLRENQALTQSVIERRGAFTDELTLSDGHELFHELASDAKVLRGRLRADGARLADLESDVASIRKRITTFVDSVEAGVASINKHPSIEQQLQVDTAAVRSTLEGVSAAKDPKAVALALEAAMGDLSVAFASIDAKVATIRTKFLLASGLPLGWLGDDNLVYGLGWKIVGMLLTIILVSFGAPFWNDVLKSLFQVRGFLRGRGAAGPSPQPRSGDGTTPS